MSMQPEIVILPDIEAVQHYAAERIVLLAQEQITLTKRFVFVLSGGSTPRSLYCLLAQEPFRSQITWSHVWIVWGDERYVVADNAESSYGMARATLLDHVAIPSEQIFPVATYYADPTQAAAIYQRQICAILAFNNGCFDVVLLGMGADGHTASLFPYHPALTAPDETFVVAVEDAPKPPSQRISLTWAALNRAKQTFVLATGMDKAATLKSVLHGPHDPQRWPIQHIAPLQGRMVWILDRAAASQLSH